ncbi:MAG TPA: cyclic nucleotide-binding domain-containing protein [Kofleriaceae bacterium]|nr:cyclic nucleotide-binding domain-containing protein [Kofleriaceae bacterium]
MTARELGALEKRLEKEPGNLPLRITLAGALRDAGRRAEAVELYRSVALAYRAQSRNQQAIAVCRSILELAPDDPACRTLFAELTDPTTPPAVPGVLASPKLDPPSGPREIWNDTIPKPLPKPRDPVIPDTRDSTTPLPRPLPYHVADPTSSANKIPRIELDLPIVEGADTRPGDEPRSDTTGLAGAARRISGLIAASLPSRITPPDFDEAPTPPPIAAPPKRDTMLDATSPSPNPSRDTDEDMTAPRELLGDEPIANAFFAALPAAKRDEAVRRSSERAIAAGEFAIRMGAHSHPLLLVVSGRLEVRRGAQVLDQIEPGGFTGEGSLLARAPALYAVVAAIDSVVLAMAAPAVFELAGAYPSLWAALKESAERRARLYAQLIRASP